MAPGKSTACERLDAHSGVVMTQDLLEALASERHAVGTHLAHADAVSPSLPGEDEGLHLSIVAILPIDQEESLSESQQALDRESTVDEASCRPLDGEIDDPARGPAAARDEVHQVSH